MIRKSYAVAVDTKIEQASLHCPCHGGDAKVCDVPHVYMDGCEVGEGLNYFNDIIVLHLIAAYVT